SVSAPSVVRCDYLNKSIQAIVIFARRSDRIRLSGLTCVSGACCRATVVCAAALMASDLNLVPIKVIVIRRPMSRRREAVLEILDAGARRVRTLILVVLRRGLLIDERSIQVMTGEASSGQWNL